MSVEANGYPCKELHFRYLMNCENAKDNENLNKEIDEYLDYVDSLCNKAYFFTYPIKYVGMIFSNYEECLEFIKNANNEVHHAWSSNEALYDALKEFWNENPNGFIVYEI